MGGWEMAFRSFSNAFLHPLDCLIFRLRNGSSHLGLVAKYKNKNLAFIIFHIDIVFVQQVL